MNKYQNINNKPKTVNWINTVLKNYLARNPENRMEVEHILDFLNSDASPKRIDRMSYQEAKKGAQEWVRLLNKRAGDIVETEADVEVFQAFTNGFRFVKLLTESAYKREGNLMRHCVASYYGNKDVTILSLRDPNNKPHCTIEYVSDEEGIKQIKGKGNGSIHPKYIKYIIYLLKKLKVPVREYELENLGYVELDNECSQLIYKLKGAKYLTYNNKKYFYLHSNLEFCNAK